MQLQVFKVNECDSTPRNKTQREDTGVASIRGPPLVYSEHQALKFVQFLQ